MEENAKNGVARTLGSQCSQSMIFLLLILGWLLFWFKRLPSILFLPLNLESCSYIIRKNWGHSAQTPPFSLPSTFNFSSAPILSSPHGWLLPLRAHHSFFYMWPQTQDTTKFSGIITFYLLTGHFLISLNIKMLSLDAAPPSKCSPPYQDQNATRNSLHMPAPLLDLLHILELHLSSISIICQFLIPQKTKVSSWFSVTWSQLQLMTLQIHPSPLRLLHHLHHPSPSVSFLLFNCINS